MLEAVLFDLDGVITDTSRYHYQAWKAVADRLGIYFDESYNEKLKGISRMESLELLLKNGGAGALYSQREKEALAFEKNEIYKSRIEEVTPMDLLPGIGALLEELRAAQIRIGIASVSKNAKTVIHKLQIEKDIDYIADVSQIKRAKPYPDIFIDCALHLQAQPINCVGIEDAKAGIEAIHRAGMKAVGVGNKEQMQQADVILESTSALSLSLLKKMTS
ncbi:MAG: beta-phosphoglucomutase [Clostridiales bacterium]|nr:beta-phosphoglucomutase [Clostridiales bacterium]